MKNEPAIRISISLPPSLATQLDRLVEARGFGNRSQAVREMIHGQLARYARESGQQVMAGTITIFYDESKPQLRNHLAEIQRRHLDEVISSQHVLLEGTQTMEVLVVQGPADTLQAIADELVSCKGVTTGGLSLSHSILPPIHAKGEQP